MTDLDFDKAMVKEPVFDDAEAIENQLNDERADAEDEQRAYLTQRFASLVSMRSSDL
jgi:hypothetical protein